MFNNNIAEVSWAKRKVGRALHIFSFFIVSRGSNLIYGFFGYSNLGDEAIKAAAGKLFEKTLTIPRLSTLLLQKACNIRSLLGVKKIDTLIYSGGTMIGADTEDGRNKFHEHFRLLRSISRSAIIFGTGVGLPKSLNDAWLTDWKQDLLKCRYVGVRGPQSAESLDMIGIKSEVIGDLAFQLHDENITWESPGQKIIVNVASALCLLDAKKCQSVLLSLASTMQGCLDAGFHIEVIIICPLDIEITHRLIAMLGKDDAISMSHNYYDPLMFLRQVRSAKVLIGVRLHAAILAACAGTPMIMLGYAPKCYDFMRSVSQEQLYLNIEEVTTDKLNGKIAFAIDNGVKISLDVLSKVRYYKNIQIERAVQTIGLV